MDDSDFNRLMDDMSDSDSGSDSMPPTPNRSPTSHGSVEKAFMSKLAMSPPSFDDGERKEEGKGDDDDDRDDNDNAVGYSGPVKTPRTSPVPDEFSDYDDEDDGGREESKLGEYALSSVDNIIMKDTYSDESSSLSDDVGGGENRGTLREERSEELTRTLALGNRSDKLRFSSVAVAFLDAYTVLTSLKNLLLRLSQANSTKATVTTLSSTSTSVAAIEAFQEETSSSSAQDL